MFIHLGFSGCRHLFIHVSTEVVQLGSHNCTYDGQLIAASTCTQTTRIKKTKYGHIYDTLGPPWPLSPIDHYLILLMSVHK